MNEEDRKKDDDIWQSQIEKEKKEKKEKYHQPTFTVFLSSLAVQAMTAIGKLENPVTRQFEKNLDRARFLIETLEIIKEKTKGNLSSKEANLLEDSLVNLKKIYVKERNNHDQ